MAFCKSNGVPHIRTPEIFHKRLWWYFYDDRDVELRETSSGLSGITLVVPKHTQSTLPRSTVRSLCSYQSSLRVRPNDGPRLAHDSFRTGKDRAWHPSLNATGRSSTAPREN